MSNIISQWQSGVGEVHFLLATGLFFLINFIGSKSYSIGYMPMSLLVKEESNLAFNFAVRVVTPVVYLIITSSCLYYLGFDTIVVNFHFISIYYILIRYGVNALQGRIRLLSWKHQFLYSLSIIFLSYFFYKNFISIKKNLLPDFSNLANELWIIIILFLYKIVNKMSLSTEGLDKRRTEYIRRKFLELKIKYGKVVDERVDNDILKSIIYGIMIYENFNRSKPIRLIENISFFLTKKPHTLGIMQVTTDKFIDDKGSVILGVRKVKEDYSNYLIESALKFGGWHDTESVGEESQAYRTMLARNEIISKYNSGHEYLSEVEEISDYVLKKYYPKTTSVLDPVV